MQGSERRKKRVWLDAAFSVKKLHKHFKLELEKTWDSGSGLRCHVGSDNSQRLSDRDHAAVPSTPWLTFSSFLGA